MNPHIFKKLLLLPLILGIISLSSIGFSVLGKYQATSIGLTIQNSFSGSLIPSSGQYFVLQDHVLWTKNSVISLDIGAQVAGTYTLYDQDNTVLLTGESLTDNYLHTYPLVLLSSHQTYSYFAMFISTSGEIVKSTDIAFRGDQQAPSSPTPTSPINNTLLQSGDILFSWGASTDSGIGLDHYTIFVSLTPDFSTSVSWDTTGTSLSLSKNSLPYGTIFWYVQAYDGLDNRSSSSIEYFHNTISSIITNNNPSGGGGYTLGTPTTLAITTGTTSSGQQQIPPEIDLIPGQEQIGESQENPIQKDDGDTLPPNTTKKLSLNEDTETIKNSLLELYYDYYNNICFEKSGLCLLLPSQDNSIQESNIHEAPNANIYEDFIKSYTPEYLRPLGITSTYITYYFIGFYIIVDILKYLLPQNFFSFIQKLFSRAR